MWIGHHKEIQKLTFRALALRRSESIRSDEGLTLETSASESLYGGQFALSTQLIKPHYPVIWLVTEQKVCAWLGNLLLQQAKTNHKTKTFHFRFFPANYHWLYNSTLWHRILCCLWLQPLHNKDCSLLELGGKLHNHVIVLTKIFERQVIT